MTATEARNPHPDALERRDPEQREADLMARLAAQVAHAQNNAPAFADLLRDVPAASVRSRAALAQLPVTRKGELLERQKARRDTDVFGGFSAIGWGAAQRRRALRVYASPGTIYEPEGPSADYWRMARALFAAGFRAGDLAHNCFSYHFTPAGADDGNRRARAGLHGVSGRHRPDRAASPRDGRIEAGRLHRHAELSEAHH